MTAELADAARTSRAGNSTPVAARVTTGRRRSYTQVHDWAQLLADLNRHDPACLLLLDVDPAVAGWRAGAAAVCQGMTRVELPLLEALHGSATLVWTTNTTRIADDLGHPPHHSPAGSRVLLGARKPRLRVVRRELNAMLDRGSVVVVGDQWLIDGLLAWRLRARFVHWDDARPSPWWARLQQLAGLLLVRPLYRPESAR